MTELAPHGGCWWEGCKICNTPDNPYPESWKGTKVSFDINTLKELTLTTKQAIWLLNRNFSNDDEWTTPEQGDTYQENLELKIQIAVTNSGGVRISTWE